MRRRLPMLIAAAVLLALPASASALVVGVGDQKPDMFRDARFERLDIHYARYMIGWDALTSPSETAAIDRWMSAAQAAGVRPLVSFAHSFLPGRRRVLPTPSRLKYEFRRFRARYPWVNTFATWNEANHCGEPVCHRPQLVGAYYNALRRECPACHILAAEVLDEPDMVSWIDSFETEAQGDPQRQIWGIHNYLDANRLRTIGTRELLAHTHGKVWFTETGGIVYRRNRSTITFPESAAHAATALRWVFDELVPLSSRITRVYVYNWNSPYRRQTWDSALIAPNGRVRPAFTIFEHEIQALDAR
jgi:hypothetical protein